MSEEVCCGEPPRVLDRPARIFAIRPAPGQQCAAVDQRKSDAHSLDETTRSPESAGKSMHVWPIHSNRDAAQSFITPMARAPRLVDWFRTVTQFNVAPTGIRLAFLLLCVMVVGCESETRILALAEIDGGVAQIDGGVVVIDGGLAVRDGGVVVIDGGLAVSDGGVRVIDGGTAVSDGGPPSDGGVVAIDGGVITWLSPLIVIPAPETSTTGALVCDADEARLPGAGSAGLARPPPALSVSIVPGSPLNVSACIRADFGSDFQSRALRVSGSAADDVCGDSCGGGLCGTTPAYNLFVSSDGTNYAEVGQFRVPLGGPPTPREIPVSVNLRYVLVCRPASSHQRTNILIDSIHLSPSN